MTGTSNRFDERQDDHENGASNHYTDFLALRNIVSSAHTTQCDRAHWRLANLTRRLVHLWWLWRVICPRLTVCTLPNCQTMDARHQYLHRLVARSRAWTQGMSFSSFPSRISCVPSNPLADNRPDRDIHRSKDITSFLPISASTCSTGRM